MTIHQGDYKPTNKVAAVGIGGTASVLAVYLAKQLFNVDLPPEVSAAIATLIAFASGYIRKEKI